MNSSSSTSSSSSSTASTASTASMVRDRSTSCPHNNSRSAALHQQGGSLRRLNPSAATNACDVARCASDSVLHVVAPRFYDNKNATFMLATRSGGSVTKRMLSDLRKVGASATVNNNNNNKATTRMDKQPPQVETRLLAEWSTDPYYRVILIANDGIRTFLQVMDTFPDDRAIQECCCLILANIVNPQSTLPPKAELTIVAAMNRFPCSFAVQSAAVEALRVFPDFESDDSTIQALTRACALLSSERQDCIHKLMERPHHATAAAHAGPQL